jgi:hypothetical protein
MSARVSEDTVHSFLTWARNYGEIESFKIVADSGRRWKIVLPEVWSENMVPREFVLTSREALAFGYGLAVGGASERRSDFASREWGW